MTEEQIERRVETRMNSLDRKLMGGFLSQSDYDAEVRKLDQWAQAEYSTLLRKSIKGE